MPTDDGNTTMLIVVDPSSGVPVFRQVMDQVRFHIASGLLQAGDELPPTRSLSAEIGVNPMTISKAYNLLERDGVLSRRPGRPLVVAPLDPAELDIQKLDQLRTSLTEAVRATKQLGIDSDDAIGAFRELLENDEKDD
jgi:GntR family transcriptional regulator